MKKSLPHDAYEEIADYYASVIDTKPHNAYYDRPAVQSLIPNVNNKLILDAGCGTGVYTDWLLNQGAVITCIDASDKMLAHAKKRIGEKATFYKSNMEEPLSFLSSNSFDGVLSSLAITYIKNHSYLFNEFNRVMKLNSWFIFSTEHPFFSYKYFKLENYFETKQVYCDWHEFGKTIKMPSYYHSLSSISNSLTDNGFIIEKILEPKPTEKFKENDIVSYKKLIKFPLFICFKAKKIADVSSLQYSQ